MPVRARSTANPFLSEPLEPRLQLSATPPLGIQPDHASWTVLVYVAADNDLEPYSLNDLNEMESATLPANIKVAALVDRSPDYSRANGNWNDTRRGQIVHDDNKSLVTSPLTSIGEQDTGKPSTLTEFIKWGVAQYPADHYALILWDHGDGLGGIAWDDTSGHHLTIARAASAIQAAGTHFDFFGTDACEEGLLEVDNQFAPVADVIVGSELDTPATGWNYKTLLNGLAANPNMSAESFGKVAVKSFGDTYGNHETIAATRSSAYPALISAIANFSDTAITRATAHDWALISQARKNTAFFYEYDYRDLIGFMNNIAKSKTTGAIHKAAEGVVTAAQDAVIANHSGTANRGQGITIYLPGDATKTVLKGYDPSDFTLLATSKWRDFLLAFGRRR